MRILTIAAASVVSFCSLPASAEWSKVDVRDEMRGTSAISYVTEAAPINGAGPTLSLTVFEKGPSKKPAAIITARDGSLAGCGDQICQVEVRFDDGGVQKISVAQMENKRLVPTEASTFVAAASLSKEFFIELAVGADRKAQYRFDVSGLPFTIPSSPQVTLLGYEFGKRYSSDQIALEKYKQNGKDACYKGGEGSKPFGAKAVASTSICFYDGVPYLALIEPGSKDAYLEGVQKLTSIFGSREKGAVMPSWPKSEDKIISDTTKRASYFSTRKNDYASVFIITDEVTSLRARSPSE